MNLKRRWIILVFILCGIGLVMVYSASHIVALEKYQDAYYFIKRQGLFFVIGFFLLKVMSHLDYHFLFKHASKITWISLALLVAVLIPGLGQVRGGSRSWFSLGPLSFQPAELFKVAIIIYFAKHFSEYYHRSKKIKVMVKPLLFLVLGFTVIMGQPDFGSGFVMVVSGIVMLFATAFPFRYFIYLGILGLVGATGLILLAPYRLVRLLSFLDPFSDPLGSGFQAIQSMYAIGPGGLLGVGFDQSLQKHFYLPEPQTDFIFAIFAEEFGFVGSFVLVSMFALLVYTGIKIALKAKDLFGFYLALGISSLLAVQIIVNLCVVTGLFPVTGIVLPYISYGGSSLVITLMLSGIVANIAEKSHS